MPERLLRFVSGAPRVNQETDMNNPKAGNDHGKNEPQLTKPYEPPKLIRINLRPEEAVLGHCKISGSAGPASGSCTILGCFSPGS
jgi:hypothetical protein